MSLSLTGKSLPILTIRSNLGFLQHSNLIVQLPEVRDLHDRLQANRPIICFSPYMKILFLTFYYVFSLVCLLLS